MTTAPSMGPVLVNSNNLESLVSGLSVVSISTPQPPKKTLSNFIVALSNRAKTTQSFDTQKIIKVTVVITQNTRTLLEMALDTLWPLLYGIEIPLVVIQSNMQRQYTVTHNDANFVEMFGGYAKIELMFTLSDSYGYDTASTLLLDQSNITTSPQTLTMGDVDGSAEYQVPLIKLWLSVVTGGTSANLIISNPANNQTLTINRTWAVDDYVEIDSQNKTVKVNGSLVDFTGMLPEWKPKALVGTGNSKITISDGLTTRKWRMRVTYNRRWA